MHSLAAEAATDPEATPLYTSLAERLTAADGAGLATPPASMLEAARAAIAAEVAAGYQALLSELEATLASVSAADAADAADAAAERAPGVCSLPDGTAYYAHKLRCETSTAMSPDEVHALGHEQVGAILSEMAATIARLAAAGDARQSPDESVASNMRRLSADPEWRFADTPGGKAACLQHFRGLVS